MVELSVSPPVTTVTASLPEHLAWAIVLAVVFSVILAAIEISSESKKPLRSCLGTQSFIYCCLLIFGNVLTTLAVCIPVSRMSPSLSPYFFLFAAFFGIFGFEAILKNTNVTILNQGVLTIQDWLKKALAGAAGAAIERDTRLINADGGRLANRLIALPEIKLNAIVMLKLAKGAPDMVHQLDAIAKANNADTILYKAYTIVSAVPESEVEAFL
jgi:glucan phosphoethanolaminetransferase (alkaline phosphatase superfamily)